MRVTSDPSMRMVYCWSQVRPSRVDWKIRCCPSWLKYASAFALPCVSCLRFARWTDSSLAALSAAALASVAESPLRDLSAADEAQPIRAAAVRIKKESRIVGDGRDGECSRHAPCPGVAA